MGNHFDSPYLCAKYPYKFSSFLYALTLFVMIMPLVGTGPARIRLMSKLMLVEQVPDVLYV